MYACLIVSIQSVCKRHQTVGSIQLIGLTQDTVCIASLIKSLAFTNVTVTRISDNAGLYQEQKRLRNELNHISPQESH